MNKSLLCETDYVLDNVLGIMDWILYWILLYACWLGWLAAFSVFFIYLISSHLISLHFIPFHVLSLPISCHVPLGDEMDQYLNMDQWQKTSQKESKKTEEDGEYSKETPESMSG